MLIVAMLISFYFMKGVFAHTVDAGEYFFFNIVVCDLIDFMFMFDFILRRCVRPHRGRWWQ